MALVTIMLVLSSELCLVHSRVLRSKVPHNEGEASSLSVPLFSLSSNNSTTRLSKRSFEFRLASGPSKRGRGH
ncbi:hypothetical protein Fmac_000447 [Flemingia macrophylla]|uniref:Secreted protein n=1 Tax=Flemingia macrophylla TaxID=520843 RepID=A0ABD1NEA0_9FABA